MLVQARAQRAFFLAILGDFERFWQQFEADLQVLALKNRCSSSKTCVSTGVSTSYEALVQARAQRAIF